MFYIRKPDRINYEFDYVLGQVLKQKRTNKGYSLQYHPQKVGVKENQLHNMCVCHNLLYSFLLY